ncbi:hypothetical protein C8Q80DRAFT_674545 [Daedaleopsis nitida]|nr:hypothetical protein C8Q80DRAFT_674545 [Daedaleopsis nitida]
MFPFVISREEAKDELSLMTSILTVTQPIEALVHRLFPGFNVDRLQPTRVQAAYLPTWLIDGQVQASAWLKKQKDTEFSKDHIHTPITHSVLPGFVFDPLSRLNFVTPELVKLECLPWSEDMRQQEGDDVACLPFSLSPFKLDDAARSSSLSDANISSSFRFDPGSVQASMLAAYPVLIPVYIASFTIRTIVDRKMQVVPITACIDGARKLGQTRRILDTGVLQEAASALGLEMPDLTVWGGPVDELRRFANMRPLLGGHTTGNHRRQIQRRIDEALGTTPILKEYRTRYFGKSEVEASKAVDWEDVRIRPFTPEERNTNLTWVTAEEDLFMIRTMLRVYESKRREGQHGGASEVPEPEVLKLMQQIKWLERERDEKKPEWLQQYELEQRLGVEHPSETGEEAQIQQS